MKKFCVFCGEKPEGKSKEHIIPRWLIELTGSPRRIAKFGFQNRKHTLSGERRYSFDAFRFPSCESCNDNFSRLEAATQPVIQKVISDDSISATEFSTLLDWFDKIRIGLWLAYLYLDKNPAGIAPKFYIARRIGVHDRMLTIFKADGDQKGLNYCGTDMPSFWYTPSCFSLRINNYCFLNISLNDLFSRRIGFPYLVDTYMIENQQILGHYAQGRNRVMVPILRKRFSIHGTELYQPMFPDSVHDPNAKKLYDTKYVHENSMSWEQGIGKVFIQDNTELKEYPVSPSKIWIPRKTYAFEALLFEMQILTFEWQIYVDSQAPSSEMLSKEEKRSYRQHLRLNKLHNKEMVQMLRKMAQEHGMPTLYQTSVD